MKGKGFNFYLLALLSFSTFILVALGGIVHNTGSSLACPDWPLCFGQVLPKMEGAVAIEHSHRLLATFTGLLTLLWLYISLRSGEDIKQKTLSKAATALVIFQGLLGGLTVLLKISPIMSTAHLVTSQIYLSVVWLGFLSELFKNEKAPNAPILESSKIFKLAPVLLVLLLFQMGVGAFIRHSGASVACGLGSASMWLCVDPTTANTVLWPSSAPAQWNMFHRILGIVTMFALVYGSLPALKWARQNNFKEIRINGVLIHVFTLSQVILGILTLATGIQIFIVTAHLVLAMILWLSLWTFWMRVSVREQNLAGARA